MIIFKRLEDQLNYELGWNYVYVLWSVHITIYTILFKLIHTCVRVHQRQIQSGFSHVFGVYSEPIKNCMAVSSIFLYLSFAMRDKSLFRGLTENGNIYFYWNYSATIYDIHICYFLSYSEIGKRLLESN